MRFQNSKKNTLYIQLVSEIESNIILKGRGFGSFTFAEGLALCAGAKANVPNVRLAKIELKKCAVGKIKNTEGSVECRLSWCQFVIRSVRWSLVKMVCPGVYSFFSSQFVVVVSYLGLLITCV